MNTNHDPLKAAEWSRKGVDVRRGDITDPDSLRGPMAGVDGVFHIAGWYKIGAKVSSWTNFMSCGAATRQGRT